MPSLGDWTNYTRWNLAIAGEFFGGRYGGRPVYIDLEQDALSGIRAALELEAAVDVEQALTDAVLPTLGVAPGTSLFGSHVRRLRTWAVGDQDSPPPIVAVLAMQSLVAEGMRTDADLRASNYYGRFMQTLGLDVDNPRARTKVIRGFGNDSGTLWGALNRWIAEDSDTRGIPTAYSFDYRVHVGLPMSQALVRASDRSAIRAVFSDLGLRPGQVIAVEDMVRLLEAWLPESRVSRGLRLMCKKEAALRRVAEVACVELEAWSGAVEGTAAGRRTMALTATLRRLPRRSLYIGLCVRAPDSLETLQLESGSDEAARAAVAATDGQVVLGQSDEEGWRPVLSELSAPDLLYARLRLGSGELRAARDPRPLVILAKSSSGAQLREAERVRLGAEHLLLAADSVRPRVEKELSAIARPGFRVHERLPGLPAEWVAIERVEIVAISDTQAPDLAALVPLAWTEVAVEGGLRLPGRATWHSGSPPEIRASAPSGRPVALTLMREGIESPDQGAEEDAEVEEQMDATGADDAANASLATDAGLIEVFEGTAILDLSSLELLDGDYRVQLFDGRPSGRALGATSFRLRSSSAPFFPVRRSTLSYATDETLGAISAHAEQRGVSGARVPNPAQERLEQPDLATLGKTLAAKSAARDDEDPPEAPVGLERRGSIPECFITGGHYFVLESAGRHRPRWGQLVEGECKHCGLEKSFPARPRRRETAHRGPGGRLSAAVETPPWPRMREEEAIDHDLLLDALCCVGTGTFAALDQLVSQRDDRPWATREAARRLVSLGHIDVELDDNLRPRVWSISPTTLVPYEGGAFLTGWRSPEILHALGLVAHRLGGRVELTPQADGPSRIGLSELPAEQLGLIASELSKDAGVSIGVEPDAASRLAGALPHVYSLRNDLPIVPRALTGARFERLEVDTLRWLSSTHITVPGAYRTTHLPRVVVHSDGRDTRLADARIAKWLAAGGPALIAHDADRRRVICHLGTEPPWLYERALVLCSGLLPTPVAGHLVEYLTIPGGIARTLAARLSAEAHANV
jgi:hypothetical protein